MTRTITTAAELDAMPPWAVVEDALGFAWVRHPGTPDLADHWVSYYGSRVSAQYVAAESPLTVLHDPSAPVFPSATREDVARAVSVDALDALASIVADGERYEWRVKLTFPLTLPATLASWRTDLLDAITPRTDR